MKTLLLPVAGKSARYPGMRPKWLLTMPNGKLMIEQSISKIEAPNRTLDLRKKFYHLQGM